MIYSAGELVDEIRALSRTAVQGREVVLVHGPLDTYASGQGWHDGTWPEAEDIQSSIRFRGYALEDAGLKTLQRIEVQTEELGTAVILKAETDGIRTVQTVQTVQIRDASKWISFGTTARTMTNANNDATAANREDYTWIVSDNAMLKSGGIPLGYMQRHKLAGMVRGAQYWVRPRVDCTMGRLRIVAVRASGTKRRDHARRQ